MEAYLGTLLGPSLAGSGHCRLPSEAIDSACPSLKVPSSSTLTITSRMSLTTLLEAPPTICDTNSFTRLRTKALDNVRNWKRDVTKSCLVHIFQLSTLSPAVLTDLVHRNTSMFKPSSRTSLQTLYELTNSTFFRKMQERFNPQNYFDCFHYIKSTINVDQSSELGIYYMKCKFYSSLPISHLLAEMSITAMYANMLAASRTCIKGGQTLKGTTPL